MTGSFWTAAVALATRLAALTELSKDVALPDMARTGARLREGIAAQAAAYGVEIRQTGPVRMPMLSFVGDEGFRLASSFAEAAVQRGVYLHPWHNWFLSTAHTDEDIDEILARTDDAFTAVRP